MNSTNTYAYIYVKVEIRLVDLHILIKCIVLNISFDSVSFDFKAYVFETNVGHLWKTKDVLSSFFILIICIKNKFNFSYKRYQQ